MESAWKFYDGKCLDIPKFREKKGGGNSIMIIVPIKEGENIERALKKFKRKFEKTGAIRELRARKNFEKPSVKRRAAKMKAIYVQHLQLLDEQ